MLKFIRYALATICFASSVGSLALWGWSSDLAKPATVARYALAAEDWSLTAFAGTGVVSVKTRMTSLSTKGSSEILRAAAIEWQIRNARSGLFGQFGRAVYFPLWYPALTFALAGVGALRLGRRFTLRSAIIATTIVAVLLGIVAAL